MKNLLLQYILLFALVNFFWGCSSDLPEEVKQATLEVPKEINYNFHVKPILSDRCFACHGPDAQNRKGALRLDTEEGAYAALTSGAGRAIVPGSIKGSVLAARILSEGEEEMMPPPESNLTLTAQEKAILIKWIQQGAVYQPHWAFMKPRKPKVPAAQGWGNNEIDQFVNAFLNEKGIEPAEQAQRPQLIRRLFFDLTGLPPSLNDLDRLMQDERPDFYEKLVDSLLNLPSFGERMAAHWLDVARFADSEGYLDDFHHTFWPYRDWVIKAFNDNLPYDKFIIWQLGGDQLPNPTRDQYLATVPLTEITSKILRGELFQKNLGWNMWPIGPVLPLPNEEVAAIRDYLKQEISQHQKEIETWKSRNRAPFEEWSLEQKASWGDPEIDSKINQYEMAFRMQTSVPEVTDLSDEPDYIFDMYGPEVRKPGSFAANCLLARRLAERDVPFIQLYHMGWDQHGNLPHDIKMLAKSSDQASAALVMDLKQRGLLEDTLVIWGGEFGRTSFSQGRLTQENYGRDHHPRCFTMWVAGGGIKSGLVYGQTDDFSYNIVKDGVHIHDFQATLLHLLGIDHEKLTFKHQGRRYRLTDVHGHVVRDILA